MNGGAPVGAALAPGAGAQAVSARRVWVGLLLAAVGIASVFNGPAFALAVTATAIGGLWELDRMSQAKGVALEFTVAAFAVAAYLGLTYFRLIARYEGDLLSITLVVALLVATFLSRGNPIMRSGSTLLGVFYLGKLTSYFIAIRNLPEIGISATIYAIFVIALTDVAAMLVGTTIGRTPLTSISPRKTVEGAVGGLVVATLVSVAFATYLQWPWWCGVTIGVITSCAAQAGDIIESAFKRDAHMKDAGRALAGHGGILDRFDSFLFGGVAFYFSLWLVGFSLPHLHELLRSARI